jgi:RNA polymerase sigma-70 factor (ECF subfamily)
LVLTVTRSELEMLEQEAMAGCAAAFGRLIRHYDHDLRGVVWAVVRNADETDDVMQVAYEKAFRSIGSFGGRSSLKTWLHSICYRAALDHVRYEGRRRHRDVDGMVDLAGTRLTDDVAIAHNELDAAMAALDQDRRAVLMLTAVLGYTFDEVAEITGTPRGTVASRAGRAREQLRKELRE